MSISLRTKIDYNGHLTVPSDIKVIDSLSVHGYKRLTSLTIPKTVKTIAAEAFENCSSLKSVKIEEGVEIIEGSAFANTAIESVVLPDSVTTLGAAAFSSCPFLSDVTLSKRLTNIDDVVFKETRKLKNISIPKNVKKIGNEAFKSSAISDIDFSDGLEEVGVGAFSDCLNLGSVHLPDSVSMISPFAFSGAGIKNIQLPQSVSDIYPSTFADCGNLENVVVKSQIIHIGKSAFKNCEKLKTINVPKSCTFIGVDAFAGCSSLENISLGNITEIKPGTFSGCTNLKRIDIPDTVTKISGDAFRGCDNNMVVSYCGLEFPLIVLLQPADGLGMDEKIECLKASPKGLVNDLFYVNALYRKRHLGMDAVNEFISRYAVYGRIVPGQNQTEFRERFPERAMLREEFERCFHGHAPKYSDAFADVAASIHLPHEKIVVSFDVKLYQAALQRGVSHVSAMLLLTFFGKDDVRKIISGPKGNLISECVADYYRRGSNNENYADTIRWLAETKCGNKSLKLAYESRHVIHMCPGDSVDKLLRQTELAEAYFEYDKIKHAYPRFAIEDCSFNLKYCTVENDNQTAFIMKPDDMRMVMLGYMTYCCQHLGGAGESAMMHGLVNENAGFWAVEDKRTGKIIAQAEVWETENNTFVFDNIEFADDRSISLFKDIIGRWLSECQYDNVYMGTGYNELAEKLMAEGVGTICAGKKPPITPFELYVLDDSINSMDEARAKYAHGADYDDIHIYSDADERCVELKRNGVVCNFFRQAPSVRNHNNVMER